MTAKIVNKKGRELAQDVLAQLRYQKIKANTYFDPTEEICDLIYSGVDISAQKHMGKLRKCGVCAKGALVISYIKKYNNIALGDIDFIARHSDELAKLLEDFFSQDQLDLIEKAFECYDSYYGDDEPYNFQVLEKRVPHPKTRLRLIMQNIVKNGGVFVPEKLAKDLKISFAVE